MPALRPPILLRSESGGRALSAERESRRGSRGFGRWSRLGSAASWARGSA
jgi:hypothetical protein